MFRCIVRIASKAKKPFECLLKMNYERLLQLKRERSNGERSVIDVEQVYDEICRGDDGIVCVIKDETSNGKQDDAITNTYEKNQRKGPMFPMV